jgi:serine/threonine protein kinase
MSGPAYLKPGDVFFDGKYAVERKLKSGGMGSVYVVRHTGTSKQLALKLMHPDIARDPKRRERFAQEARISAKIDAPEHIVQVTDAGVDDATNAPFIVMELLQGRELGELVAQRGALPPVEALGILSQLAEALLCAHAKAIIHRDIKPENLFLVERPGKPPQLKVLDFGIAKILSDGPRPSQLQGGSIAYMAPEQTDSTSLLGPGTDIWAFGLVAYTLLVGRPYWQGEFLQIIMELRSGDYPSACATARAAGVILPPGFDDFFRATVTFRLEDRAPSVDVALGYLLEAYGLGRAEVDSSFRAGSLLSTSSGAARVPPHGTEPIFPGGSVPPVVARPAPCLSIGLDQPPQLDEFSGRGPRAPHPAPPIAPPERPPLPPHAPPQPPTQPPPQFDLSSRTFDADAEPPSRTLLLVVGVLLFALVGGLLGAWVLPGLIASP